MLKQNRLCRLAAFLFLILTASSTGAQTLRERHDRIRSSMEGADYKTALTELQSLSEADPAAFTSNNYDYLLGRLSQRLGNPSGATVSYQRVAARNSILSQYALWHLAELARLMGDLTLEREKLRQLLALAPASLLRDAVTARLGESFFESKDYADAIQTFRPRADAKGNSSAREALALIGQAYLQSGQKDAARAALNQLVTQLPNPTQPDDFALAGVRGLDLIDSGSEEALAKAAPQLPEGEHLRRAAIYNFNRDFMGARRHYQAIVERYGQSSSLPEALYMIGRGFYQEGNYEEAINYFKKVTTQFPDSSNARDALNFTGGAYSRLKRFDDAISAYKSFMERYGGGSGAERPYLNIIDALRDAGRDADALAWAEQTRAKFKGQLGGALALFSQARIHLAQGAWALALSDFDALRNEQNLGGVNTPGGTNQTEIAFTRAYLLEQLGRTEEAVNAYLSIPDGRNEYYGGRATARLRALSKDEKARSAVQARLEALRADAQKALSNRQFEDARRTAQSALRLTDDDATKNELTDVVRRAYSEISAYANVPTGQLLHVGRQNVLAGNEANPNTSPNHKALADELLFLGLYDEGAPELAVAENAFGSPETAGDKNSSTNTSTNDKAAASSSTLSRDAQY
ncbi:MAG: tetratricopeptide repeat protein, partial [Acidobacteriota bacterium]|nr:tetratricopeptide repeat protein [Acidobacteriota bacterium]